MWIPAAVWTKLQKDLELARLENGALRAGLGAANATLTWLQTHVNRLEADRATLLALALRVKPADAPGAAEIVAIDPMSLASVPAANVGVGTPTKPGAPTVGERLAAGTSFEDVGDAVANELGLEDAPNLKE